MRASASKRAVQVIAEERPEFGSHGTHVATVRQVLTHSAGVLGVPVEATPLTGSRLGERR